MITINKSVTSKQEILNVCRDMVSQTGILSINMRDIALKCNIALGSLYNYFPSKEQLIIATVESVWQDIFHAKEECTACGDFDEYVQHIFENAIAGVKSYPNFFTAHSLIMANGGSDRAASVMNDYFKHMKMGLISVLGADEKVKPDAFGAEFTKEKFVDFVFVNIVSLLMSKSEDCTMLVEIIKRSIY